MSLVVVDQAEEVFLDQLTAADLRLVLFTNDLTAGLTADEIDELTQADLTVATFAGYAAAVLTGGAWVTTPGNPSSAGYAAQTFTRSSTGTAQLVRGYAVLRHSDGFLLWFEQFPAPVSMEFSGDQLVVTPLITLDDTEGNAVETGSIVMTGRATAPTGWLLCDGAAVSRTTFAALFTAIGTAYGVGDGSTTFNLPDLRQRFPLGKAASGTGATLGSSGGAVDHVHGLDTASSFARITVGSVAPHVRADRKSTVNWTRNNGVTATSGAGSSATENSGVTLAGDSDTENPPFQVVNFLVKT